MPRGMGSPQWKHAVVLIFLHFHNSSKATFDAPRAFFLGAGYAPAGQLLFLACPSKSNQKERHPAYRPLQGFPALLAMPGGCGTRASRSDSPRRLPPAYLRYSAAHRGPETHVNTNGASAFRSIFISKRNMANIYLFACPDLCTVMHNENVPDGTFT